MQIGLIDVDGHNFPNLALMKISAHHKFIGDKVEWYHPFNNYDVVYKAKVFTFTSDYSQIINNANQIICGGTGYKTNNDIPNDKIQPDYTLYQNSKFYKKQTAFGFLTRGCIRNCSWCIVPQKEGKIRPYMDIEDIIQNKKQAILMDNNVLACDYGIQQLEKIVKLGIKIDFNQGLDARIIVDNPQIADLLTRVKWLNQLRVSFDHNSMYDVIEKTSMLLRKKKKNFKMFCYVLLTDLQDSYDRINFCRKLNILPFAQPFRDFTPNQIIPQWQKDMARYCNRKETVKTIDFKEFKPRLNFKCSKYFEK